MLYADGSAHDGFRPGIDLELSHWVPTTTPPALAADTSTEICLDFVSGGHAGSGIDDFDLAVNNHADVDGILSLFALVHPDVAVAHRALLVGAAEHGDLQAAAPQPSVILAQAITREAVAPAGLAIAARYERAFALVLDALDDAGEPPLALADAADAWVEIERGHRLLDDGTVDVSTSGRLATFRLPTPGDRTAMRASSTVPPFNAVVDASALLWPHARNRDHGEHVHLVSVPVDGGWHHDIHYPGYSWAHTPNRWRPPGLMSTGSSNEWQLDHPPLTAAVETLQSLERSRAIPPSSGPAVRSWCLADRLTPFSSSSGRGFPVVLTSASADDGRVVPSALDPDEVSAVLAPAFA